ncbi:M20 family metallopeptidase [Mesorhizobium koreense]|uniref:M20 family metallopeptidase n=1 Tax=Mesorhizobium koreense TaxID=3074855 RepID=UPI00287B9A15|nr:M20 family metallopeptidase [Mesorhizobium sp. WR6]
MHSSVDHFLDELKTWIEVETPTHDREAVNRLGTLIEKTCRAEGLIVDRVSGAPGLGDTIRARSIAPNGRKGLLVLAHFDTVHPTGTLADGLPWRRDGDRLYGPGTSDMKACGLLTIEAWRTIRAEDRVPDHPITFLFTPDEEIGSPGSRGVIEAEARNAFAVLVVEAARDGGKIVTARKGVARFTVKAEGVASHAGTAFDKGASAISEMARQIAYLDSLVDIGRGITLNVGLIDGGTAPNTVAQFCTIEVDVRVRTLDQAEPIVKAIHGIKPHNPNVRLTVEGDLNRPPFFPDAGSTALFEHARKLAAPIGIDLVGIHAGGGSDGNFTAALGVPTLDGLGVDGAGAHTLQEHIFISSVEPRVDLFAALLAETTPADVDAGERTL